jgi:hypothetical protein
MVKIKIDVNEVLALRKRMDEINSIELKDIIWMDGEKEISIPPERIERWRFVGLNNTCFVEMGLHDNGEEFDKEFEGIE